MWGEIWGEVTQLFAELPTKVQVVLIILVAAIVIGVILWVMPKARRFQEKLRFKGVFGMTPDYGTSECRRSRVRNVLRFTLSELKELERDLEAHNATAKDVTDPEESLTVLDTSHVKQLEVNRKDAALTRALSLALLYGYGHTSAVDGTNPIIDAGLRDRLPEDLVREHEEVIAKKSAAGSGFRTSSPAMS